MLQEINIKNLEYFLELDLNVPSNERDLIKILNQMVPGQYYMHMININFQPFNKSMAKDIEYMEYLEILQATTS